MELKMKAVCEGRKTRREVIEETVAQYRAVYERTQQRLDVLRAVSHPSLVHCEVADILQSVRRYVVGEQG